MGDGGGLELWPGSFEMRKVRVGCEARWLIWPGQGFDGSLDIRQLGDLFVATEKGLTDDRPR